MRSSLLFATAAAFLAPVQAQAKAPSKAVASFYHNEGSCDDADLGAEVTMFDSGNATVRADARAFYTILYAKTDPACTVEYVVDWTRMKWNSNQKRDEAVSSLANVDVDVKDLHVITWGETTTTTTEPVHPIARRQGGGTKVIVKTCASVAYKDEGILAIQGIEVTGC